MVDGYVHFYFNWLRAFGGWLVILVLAVLPVLWLFNDSALRLLPVGRWRLAALLSFLLFAPTLLLNINAALNAETVAQVRRPEYQLSAALGLVMLVLVWVIVGSYFVIHRGWTGSESGLGLYRIGEADPHLARAQIRALGLNLAENDQRLYPPQRTEVAAVLIDRMSQRHYPLFTGQTYIGRSRENGIILRDDRSVSRRHGLIWETTGMYVLHNMVHANPIRCNNQPMRHPHILRHGDTIRLGRTELMFYLPPAASPVSPARPSFEWR